MYDRIPTPGQEGRMLISPEGGTPYYATVAMADNPTQEGTFINKATLLKDATAALFGLGAAAVPDDVFGWSVVANTGYVHVIAKTEIGGMPGVPVLVDGVYAGKTDASGKARVSVPFGQHTVKVVRTVDIESVAPDTFNINVTNSTATVLTSFCVESSATEVTISESGVYGFSDRVEDFDLCVVGGGGGGGAKYRKTVNSDNGDTAGGGGGGYVTNRTNLAANQYNCFSATVGAGGIGGNVSDFSSSTKTEPGADGGTSSFKSMLIESGFSADGGKAGKGGSDKANGGYGGSGGGGAAGWSVWGAGAGGQDGADGESKGSLSSALGYGGTGQGTTTKPFADESKTALSPGGGGAAVRYGTGATANGAAQSGGSRGVAVNGGNAVAVKGTVIGSGGGGAVGIGSSAVTGADGADGGILLRWRYAS